MQATRVQQPQNLPFLISKPCFPTERCLEVNGRINNPIFPLGKPKAFESNEEKREQTTYPIKQETPKPRSDLVNSLAERLNGRFGKSCVAEALPNSQQGFMSQKTPGSVGGVLPKGVSGGHHGGLSQDKPPVILGPLRREGAFEIIGSFGSEVSRGKFSANINAGSDVKVEFENASSSFNLKNDEGFYIGQLPLYISTWLCILIKWIDISAKIPKYKTNKLLVILFVHALLPTLEECTLMSPAEINAWRTLAENIHVPFEYLLPTSQHIYDTDTVTSMKIVPSKYRHSLGAYNLKRKREEEVVLASKRPRLNSSTEYALNNSDNVDSFAIEQSKDISHESLKSLLETLDDSNITLEETEPAKTLLLSLRSYQKQALTWMIKREAQIDIVNKFRKLPETWRELESSLGKKYYFNVQTKQTTYTFPYKEIADHLDFEHLKPAVRGGILADQMGMGKSIEILALILTNKSTDENCKSTLIVCPLSVLTQWESEITKHSEKGAVSCYIYHGVNRKKDPVFLSSFDIVLSTYSTLSNESQSSKRTNGAVGLQDVNWFRVVLDEAHYIKDKTTCNAKSVCSLSSQCRWAVTGTPIQNKLDDVFSLLHFLQVDPYGDINFWNHIIMKPIRAKDEKGLRCLQSVLKTVLLRRTKEQKSKENGTTLANLPPRIIKERRLQFDPEERVFYQRLWNLSKQTFRQLSDGGNVLKNYAHILELLLRLRQACDHPSLVLNSKGKTINGIKEDLGAEFLNSEMNLESILESHPVSTNLFMNNQAPNNQLLNLRKSGGLKNSGFLTPAGSLTNIDLSSFTSVLKEKHPSLNAIPYLEPNNAPRTLPFLSFPPQKQQYIEKKETKLDIKMFEDKNRRSTKINAMIQELREIESQDPQIKSIVFSQWTSMLDLLDGPLSQAKISYVRLDGTMTQAQRQIAVETFTNDPSVKVFLISINAGGLGLNLTVASRVFLLDPWWNPATEDQAIDRVHRIGQTREVIVYRYIMKDSVEERILELQEKKRILAQGALGLNEKDKQMQRMEELKLIFQD